MTTEPLQNLTEQSAKIGAWLLVVAYDSQKTTYSWTKGSKSGTGERLDWVLVSPDCSAYCGGTFRKKGSEPQATQKFKEMEAKFKKGTIWKVTNVTLAKQNPKYVGAPCKVLIDMGSSTFSPVLQSTVTMPTQAAPPEKLADLLKCPAGQLVDVTALVTDLSAPVSKTTGKGPRDYVEVTIMDDSGEKGAAKSVFPAWFKPGSTIQGPTTYSTLQKALAEGKPVAFFNLVVCGASEHDKAPAVLKTSIDHFSFHISTEGDKAQRLTTDASTIKTTSEATVITEIPTFTPNERKDYLSGPATITSCRLLQYLITAAGASEHTPTEEILQINHARVLEPKKNEQLHTNAGDRLFPLVRVMDVTGGVELRMREKAVLALGEQTDAGALENLVNIGALNFPILCTMRVVLRKKDDNEIDAVIVEAAAQDVDEPKAMPNASMDFLSELMRSLPAGATEHGLAAAPLSALRHGGHAGMVVDLGGGEPMQATCVISLVAHVGRSSVVDLPGGHKLVSDGCWNVPFGDSIGEGKEEGAPEHADYKIKGELASYCTALTVQDYTLTGRKSSDPVYAVIIVSGVNHAAGRNTYMVDKVDTNIIDKSNVPTLRSLLRKLARVKCASTPTGKLNKAPDWLTQATPFTAKKARTLGVSPTDGASPSLPKHMDPNLSWM